MELNEDNQRALYVPERFAHGYQVIQDSTDTTYCVGAFYDPNAEGKLLCNEPRLDLQWPFPVTIVSKRDRRFRSLDDIEVDLKRRMSIA